MKWSSFSPTKILKVFCDVHVEHTAVVQYIVFSFLHQVVFLNEAAEDGGGPAREFWCLLSKAISQNLFEGFNHTRVLRHDSLGLQVCWYNLVFIYVTQGSSQKKLKRVVFLRSKHICSFNTFFQPHQREFT